MRACDERPKLLAERAQLWACHKPSGWPEGVRARVECRSRPMILSRRFPMGPRPVVSG